MLHAVVGNAGRGPTHAHGQQADTPPFYLTSTPSKPRSLARRQAASFRDLWSHGGNACHNPDSQLGHTVLVALFFLERQLQIFCKSSLIKVNGSLPNLVL